MFLLLSIFLVTEHDFVVVLLHHAPLIRLPHLLQVLISSRAWEWF
jgi:hypothetical protein